MNTERLIERLIQFLVTAGGIVLAIFLAKSAGDGSPLVPGVFSGIIALVLILGLREMLWVIIPIMWTLRGQILVLPLPFSPHDLTILVAFIGFLTLIAFKVVRRKTELGAPDYVLALLVIYMVTVFVRNPVGFSSLNSARVGGRPYIVAIISLLGYWVLLRAAVGPRGSFWLMLATTLGRCLDGLLGLVLYYFPAAAGPASYVYSQAAALAQGGDTIGDSLNAGQEPGVSSGRILFLFYLGTPITLLLIALRAPLSLLNPFRFGRFLLFGLAGLAVLMSGFRSIAVQVAAYFLLALYFRNGMRAIFKLGLIVAPIAALLLLMHGTVFEFPLSVQRALSFLPGKWDYIASQEAEDSTRWRTFMWKEALFGEKYIQNKWLGDGFGFSMRDFDMMISNAYRGGVESQQENFLISGQVHSGPISTIRFAGFAGLAIFLLLIILTARKAWRLIRLAQNTPYFSLSLFIGAPIVWYPVHFIALYGAFDADLSEAMFHLGMLHMLDNSLKDYKSGASQKVEPLVPEVNLAVRRPSSVP